MRELMPNRCPTIYTIREVKRRPLIVCGRLLIVNGQLPPASSATLADSEGPAHQSATQSTPRTSTPREGGQMTPLLDDARR
jgi:hypothetical protein